MIEETKLRTEKTSLQNEMIFLYHFDKKKSLLAYDDKVTLRLGIILRIFRVFSTFSV